MSILQRLLYWIGLRRDPGPQLYEVTVPLHVSIKTLAEHEDRPAHEVHLDIVAAGLTHYSNQERTWKKWESLTPREQDVTAFACLGFSNKQIALRMGITEAGVKFHLRNVYAKLQVKNRKQLSQAFKGWDFDAWLQFPRGSHLLK